MHYQLYQAQADLLSPMRRFARMGASLARASELGDYTPGRRRWGAMLSLIGDGAPTHRRPPFGIDAVCLAQGQVGVTEEVVDETPFGALLRFRKETAPTQPRVLLVAPMSGHFATLLRGTVAVLLPEHDVYITDWKNARDTPCSAGPFGLDDFIDHLIRYLERIGPGAHVIAVCQPSVPALAAVALMAQHGHDAQPRSLTLMAGPIDTRISPTTVNELALSRPLDWFERRLIDTVPWRYRGAGRRVYPGFVQLAAFLGMNLGRHVGAHLGQLRNLVAGDVTGAEAHRAFYGEYRAVMDLPAEFYLETVQRVFQDHHLPRGLLTWRGEPVRPSAIRRTALLTVEGERDDICAVGQTMAALDLCDGLPRGMKQHHLQPEVGHYGVFSGRRWAQQVYPRVRAMIQATDR
jgi:poly(3-hydroxybutyrate) depolymerase